jgi:hypothetical protein
MRIRLHNTEKELNKYQEGGRNRTLSVAVVGAPDYLLLHLTLFSGQPAWQLAALSKHSVGFTADPDPALFLNADPDPGSLTNVDKDPDQTSP